VDVSGLNRIDLPKASITKTFDRAPTKEELQKILTFADIRGKALAEIAVASGLRLGTILSLRWKDITFEQDYTTINIEPEEGRKTSHAFFTFLTPEAKRILLEYKQFRERQGETVNAESFVIGNRKRPNESLSVAAAQIYWERLLETAGLHDITHKYHVLHFHVLRKFFKTACTNAGVRREFIEYWMGHVDEGLDDSYFRASVKEHLEQYRSTIPYLSIVEAPTLISREQLQKEVLTALPKELLEPLAQKHGLSVDQLRNILAKRGSSKGTEETEERGLENIMDVIRAEKDSEDCQKIVSEEELPKFLAQKWKVVTTLPSGKIVITNE
jgi:hypothetical protein